MKSEASAFSYYSRFVGWQRQYFRSQFPFVCLPVLLWVKVMVFVDFFAVALVVPILSSYFRDAGVETRMYGLMSSAYSVAQLAGGVVLGFLSDSVSKRSILLVSFIGSAVSYLIAGSTSSIYMLFFSRILVGSVKQTMSTTSLIVSQVTQLDTDADCPSTTAKDPSSVDSCDRNRQEASKDASSAASGSAESQARATERRTRELAQISAVSTACFVLGPSLGGVLYKADKRLPAVAACALFAANSFICCCMLRPEDEYLLQQRSPNVAATAVANNSDDQSAKKYKNAVNNAADSATVSFTEAEETWLLSSRRLIASVPRYAANLWSQLCATAADAAIQWQQIGNHRLLFIIVMRLLLLLVQSSLSSRNVLHYFEDRFGLQTYQLGFISSLFSVVSMLCEALFVGPIMRALKLLGDDNEMIAQLLCLLLLACAGAMESMVPSLALYIVFTLLPVTVAGTVLGSVVRSSFINEIPPQHLGKVWGLFNVAATCVGVVAPLYGSQVFSLFPAHSQKQTEQLSQPPPLLLQWGSAAEMKGYVGAVHYVLLLLIAAGYLGYCNLTATSRKAATTEAEGTRAKTNEKAEKQD